ncbi:CHAP domain-containing protein [Verrucomicrobiaceae bacterium R5-34]|nr:CHAP domain-containing protein [Verrucomicrobiaceae bacterium R5-34]
MKKSASAVIAVLVGSVAVGYLVSTMNNQPSVADSGADVNAPIGSEVARYKNVPAFQNGTVITTSHGKHYAADGYYYGQKWQCVEYVKRFFHDALGHHMPSVWGHARDFYDPAVTHGAMNPVRGLRQYLNGGDVAPQPDDLLVFSKGSLGHVAIVTKVEQDAIEVIQQNVHGAATARHRLLRKGGTFTVGESHQPTAWLRLPAS